jgi:ubiquinone/menaquinone biosynthesis C-methylase UbiE
VSDPLHAAVEARYGALAATATSLSCGGAAELAAVRPGESCLDLGCGRGRDALRLAELTGPTGRVVGVDLTARMVDEARRAAAAAGAANVDIVQARLDATGLPDGSIDVVVSSCAINHAADKPAVWREVWRVLAPGGRFVVSDIYSVLDVPARWRDDPAAVAECWAGAVRRDVYLATLAAVGFTEIRVLEESAPYHRGAIDLCKLTVAGKKAA